MKSNVVAAGEAGAIETAKAMGDDYPVGIMGQRVRRVQLGWRAAAHKEYIARLRVYLKEEHPSSWPITGYIGMQSAGGGDQQGRQHRFREGGESDARISVDTPIGKQTFRSKDHQANRAQFWGKMTKDPRYPFAVMSPPTYIDPTPFMD